ncbi:SDR family oxidoreductase [Nocardioides sp. NPDC006303]|uniref:SDR family oxidoreductase n=1 Tax=Nocardioides sp. NPDC006303 TaxID=3156747 RepID=UPI0033A3D066
MIAETHLLLAVRFSSRRRRVIRRHELPVRLDDVAEVSTLHVAELLGSKTEPHLQAGTAVTNSSLTGRTALISGGSRGIGLSIALRLAREGANIALLAKTDTPNPRLPGTVHTAAAEIEAAGGQALAVVGDVRDRAAVSRAVSECVTRFGGIDIVVNNASAINLSGWGDLDPKRFDLMLDVNVRGTFSLVTEALPHLLNSEHAHVLTLSPPLNVARRWLATHAPYTLTKYAMTMLTLGLAEQYRGSLAANCLWPETLIATAAVQNIVGGDEGMRAARSPQIMADAAAVILEAKPGLETGHCHIDSDVLRCSGETDLSGYAAVPGTAESDLELDLFI